MLRPPGPRVAGKRRECPGNTGKRGGAKPELVAPELPAKAVRKMRMRGTLLGCAAVMAAGWLLAQPAKETAVPPV